jgi:hypothetical protein
MDATIQKYKTEAMCKEREGERWQEREGGGRPAGPGTNLKIPWQARVEHRDFTGSAVCCGRQTSGTPSSNSP